MVRYNPDPRLRELENELWQLHAQLEQAKTPLQKRLLHAALVRLRNEYRRIPQGCAFETEINEQ